MAICWIIGKFIYIYINVEITKPVHVKTILQCSAVNFIYISTKYSCVKIMSTNIHVAILSNSSYNL